MDDLRAIADRLPEPLKFVARDRCCSRDWLFGWAQGEGCLMREKQDVNAEREKLQRAIARGGYYTKSYGRDWKRVLVRRLRRAHADLVFVFGCRAAVGHTLAQRRLLWFLIARRWRGVQESYQRVLHAQQEARRTRNVFTGAQIKRGTIEQRKYHLDRCRNDLSLQLQALADVPTPSYREWRTLVAK